MENQEIWNSAQVSKYLAKQLNTLCKEHGFVTSPRQTKKLVRIGEHHVQIIFPEIIYGKVKFHMQVFPSAALARYYYSDSSIIPRRSNDPSVEDNFYHRLSINDWRTTLKLVYDAKVIQDAWNAVIAPQVEKEMISLLDEFDFKGFIFLTKTGHYNPLQYCSCPANDDALQNLAMAHNEIWLQNYKSGMELLEQAISKYEAAIKQSEQFGFEVTQDEREEPIFASELLSALRNDMSATTSNITNRMLQIEQTALNKTWGVALSSEGKTVRIKKKDLL